MFVAFITLLATQTLVSYGSHLEVVSRKQWGAIDPKSWMSFVNQVDEAVLEHTNTLDTRHNRSEWEQTPQIIQNCHLGYQRKDEQGSSYYMRVNCNMLEDGSLKMMEFHPCNYVRSSKDAKFSSNLITQTCPGIVSRQQWGAQESKIVNNLTSPVEMVFIHHTYIPAACHNRSECSQTMQSIQETHMVDQGWDDIGYNFAVGADAVYEGRGWEVVGAHTLNYNSRSLGIAFIGDYRGELPTQDMISMATALIRCGVEQHFIRADHCLLGARQVRDTESPGKTLFQQIQSWSHWCPHPP